ncbi:MAG: ABC transporter permease [Candidatus Lokiarchaeota archaeon]|nr:ABC transporter permease [Candidatus Lokiarchaeota archaeon]
MSMIKFIIRRLIAMIPVLFGTLTLVFVLSRLMPGDPILAYLPEGKIDPDLYAQMRHNLGFDLPIYVQYFRYLGDLFVGNWGYSISINKGQDVWSLIMQRLPRTVDIAIFSMLIAGFLGIKTGVISAVHRNKPKDTILRGLALIGVAIPIFFMGMLLQFTIGYLVPIFPTTGFKTYEYGNPEYVTGFRIIDAFLSGEFYMIGDYLYHLVLPVACLSFIILAGITRQSRSSMLEVLEQDYVRTARAKGCKEKDVINTHARKNSLIPTITVIGLSFAGLLSGAVLTETTFGLVGVGELLIASIRDVDYWVMNALVFIITIMFVSINLVTDIIYAMLDPRIVY